MAQPHDETVILPDSTITYSTKDAMRAFCLKESEVDLVPYTSQRNFSGPYPIRQYKGADLLAAAQEKYIHYVAYLTAAGMVVLKDL